ncbi:MAG: hypothetical protein HN583_08425 [Kordiimonadaceae bacterium]|jgi:nickel/cobalt exporter|nr:hypothetical protein [Kordiimonadaceae bacterium]MBT6466101.1 hypothetical protein [Kordiimonadaceae bacterium]MBT7605696.1 hypothetical protein [Kordiimonadaceae bacterium]
MENEFLILWGAASIAFIHTLLGPDHYLPFVAVGKARGWSLPKTGLITLLCGVGHSVGSILLGFFGVYTSGFVTELLNIESVRGDVAAWSLLCFGILYATWGIRKAFKDETHAHWHTHADGIRHNHPHNHHRKHAHVHAERTPQKFNMKLFAPWALFIIFVLGPCEPLIPLMMVPAAAGNYAGVAMTVGIFTAVTIATMMSVVVLTSLGLKSLSMTGFQKYSHAFAGGTISLCAFGMLAFGL